MKTDTDTFFELISEKAKWLQADTSFFVRHFGKNKDLLLKIYKNPLYDGTPEFNQVTFHISKDGVSLENTWFIEEEDILPSLKQYYETDFFSLNEQSHTPTQAFV